MLRLSRVDLEGLEVNVPPGGMLCKATKKERQKTDYSD